MATLIQIANLFSDERLRLKAKAAILIAAGGIRTEATTTTMHAERVLWADMVFQNPDAMRDRMMPALLSNGSIQTNGADSPDNDIQFVISASVNDFAPTIPV